MAEEEQSEPQTEQTMINRANSLEKTCLLLSLHLRRGERRMGGGRGEGALRVLVMPTAACIQPQHQRSAAQHTTARHGTAQHSTAQYSTAQYSTAVVQRSSCAAAAQYIDGQPTV